MHIATTVTYETEEQINKFKKMAKNISDLVTVGRTKLDHFDEEPTRLSNEQKEIRSQLKTKQSLVKKRYSCCPEVYGKLSIDWDGEVVACCDSYDREMSLGNIHYNTLQDMFNGKILSEYREILSNGQFDKIPLCRNCWDYMAVQGENKA